MLAKLCGNGKMSCPYFMARLYLRYIHDATSAQVTATYFVRLGLIDLGVFSFYASNIGWFFKHSVMNFECYFLFVKDSICTTVFVEHFLRNNNYLQANAKL